MGGVAGHMDHLFENRSLTFDKIKEILTAVSNGEVVAEEKVDGQNLFLSYSVPENKAKGARNKGNLRAGGMDATELAHKFAGRGNIEAAFTNGFATFEKAVSALSDEEKTRIFGPDTNIWYNAEVMDPGAANIIRYDAKTLKIHDVGHFIFDRETDIKAPIPAGTLELLDSSLERMNAVLSDEDFNLVRRALIQLQKLEDDKALHEATNGLDREMREEGLSGKSTILDYMISRLNKGIDAGLPDDLRDDLIKYLLKLPDNPGLRKLKKGLPENILASLVEAVSAKRQLLQQAIEPIEMIIHDFAVEILKGLESAFISDNDAEVVRLRTELSDAVEEMTKLGPENPQAMEVMQRHLNKIRDISKVSTAVEAIVFSYDGHVYKFSGNFAPLNQVLGMFRYNRFAKKTNESVERKMDVITEKEGVRLALFPGKFKPPHRGHLEYANQIAKRNDVDEVLILISPVDQPEVNSEQSLAIWNEYLKDGEPNIRVEIAEFRSPVKAVYDFVTDPNKAEDGDTILLIKSSKDVGDKRFDRVQSYVERYNPGVQVDFIIEDPVTSEGGIAYSARDMRKAINEGDFETFASYLPANVDAEAIWKSLTGELDTAAIDGFIDDTLDEMAAMGAGAVSGFVGGFNIAQPKKRARSKTKRGSVRKAKRQKRR